LKIIDGRLFKGQAMERLFRVAHYSKLHKEKYKLDYNIAQSTSVATGLLISSVKQS
jgi:hypothetical protein